MVGPAVKVDGRAATLSVDVDRRTVEQVRDH